MTAAKYRQVADRVRGQIEDGMLLPGEPAPSGASLSRATGYSILTCRKGLRTLIREGVLIPGASPGARPRVPSRGLSPGARSSTGAARALSQSLAARRRAAGLTQTQLAELAGVSVTAIGHAETGRLWQSRRFWERADKGVNAGGELLALHDAYRAAAVPADPATAANDGKAETAADVPPTAEVAASGHVAYVTITWADGAVTTVYPPETPARPAHTTPA
jgi:DNA-binding transcriptional regulator YhcF (GntR family)